MPKKEIPFSNFLSDIEPEFEEPAKQLHELMTGLGCPVVLKTAKSGHVVSFLVPGGKKTVANFVVRKKGPLVRIYGDRVSRDAETINAMPEPFRALVVKSGNCKRLIDPDQCSPRCAMGYQLELDGEVHKKCRYGCFMFPMTFDTLPYLKELLGKEVTLRCE